MGSLTRLWADVRAHPLAATLELGTITACVLLFVGTIVALVSGPPAEHELGWLAIVVGGASVVLLWTFVVPLCDRYLWARS